MPTAAALGFSNAMAALNCTAAGARGRIDDGNEARQLIASGTARRMNPSIAAGALLERTRAR
jgi:hypothetical protein